MVRGGLEGGDVGAGASDKRLAVPNCGVGGLRAERAARGRTRVGVPGQRSVIRV